MSIESYLIMPIINLKYISLDYWSIIHLITGLIFGLLLSKKKWGWFLTLFLLTLYEFIENIYFVDILFLKESLVNIIWDIIIGMLGFIIILLFKKRKKCQTTKPIQE